MIRFITILFFTFFLFNAQAQFAPAAGVPGTSAMHKDSSAFIDWAKSCTVVRGYQNIDNIALGYTTAGDSTMATLIAGSNGVVSLGDGGYAICTFNSTVSNGSGYDFAVFENSFSDEFLEYAFVEVSSNGVDFFRFPATSYIQDTLQTGPFDTTGVPEKINNLAGKYRALYGTPFDLEELNGTMGLDVNNITHIKIVDAIGSINQLYATFDQYGNKINDPWPTEFPTGGFDLDAIGIINNHINSISESSLPNDVIVYPNPFHDMITIELEDESYFEIYSAQNKFIFNGNKNGRIDLSNEASGIYFLKYHSKETTEVIKLFKL